MSEAKEIRSRNLEVSRESVHVADAQLHLAVEDLVQAAVPDFHRLFDLVLGSRRNRHRPAHDLQDRLDVFVAHRATL